jgi:hypothetical protein
MQRAGATTSHFIYHFTTADAGQDKGDWHDLGWTAAQTSTYQHYHGAVTLPDAHHKAPMNSCIKPASNMTVPFNHPP